MTTYRPEQRAVTSRILTSAGWLTGTFHVPWKSRLVEQLNRPRVFFPLTDVTLHGRDETLPFLALQRLETVMVLPPPNETDLQYTPEVEPLTTHQVTCLLEFGLLRGTIETLRGVRISDFFLHKQGFLLLTDCSIRLGGLRTKTLPEEHEARVVINSLHVLGISDSPEPTEAADGEPAPLRVPDPIASGGIASATLRAMRASLDTGPAAAGWTCSPRSGAKGAVMALPRRRPASAAAALTLFLALLPATRSSAQDDRDREGTRPMQVPGGLEERVTVVSRTIPAVNFRRPGSVGTHLDFVGTALAPGAHGQIDVDAKKGYVQVQSTTWGLPPAASFGSESMTYVLWAITPEGRPNNLGEFLVEDKRDARSRLEVTSDLQSFGLIVTAEPHFAVTRPSDVVVLENAVKPGTKGEMQPIEAKFELLQRGSYSFHGSSRTDLEAPSAPFYVIQTRNARRIALDEHADRYAADTFAEAERLREQAESQREAKQRLALAKQAAQTYEDARLVAAKKMQEEREAEAHRRAASAEREAGQAQQEAAGARADAAEATRQAAESDAARSAAEAEAERARAAADEAERARAAAEREKAELRARLLEQFRLIFEARDTARGLILNMPNVLFDFNKSTLRPEAREKLARLAGIVISNPGLQLAVEGHTDSIGSPDYNQTLSEKRAGAVRDYLVTQGVRDADVTARGLGETQPVASNDTAEGRQQNRRVEIVVTGDIITAMAQSPP